MSDYGSKSPSSIPLTESVRATRANRTPQSMSSDYSGWAGLTVLAAVLLLLSGAFQVIQGLVAVFSGGYYEVASSELVIDVSYTAWGVAHLTTGGIALAAGVFLFAGRMWARIVGVVVAGASAIANFAFLTAHPVWATLVIVLDILIIVALTVHGRDLADHG